MPFYQLKFFLTHILIVDNKTEQNLDGNLIIDIPVRYLKGSQMIICHFIKTKTFFQAQVF